MMELHLSDEHGKELVLTPYDDDNLTVRLHAYEQISSLKIHSGDVDRLWEFLGKWLNKGSAPAAPVPLTAADVRAIAAQVATEVVALHTSPQARLSDAVAARLCTLPGCQRFPGASEHFEHDAPAMCEGCREGNHPHVFRPCPRDGCECRDTVPATDPEPHDVGHPLDPVGTSWSDRIWNVSGPVKCTITIPAGVVLTDPCGMCGHLWIIHERAPKPPAPPQTPCGLCGKPWHDGHGYPGDPCAMGPRQLVGCECGHRWGAHTTEYPPKGQRGCAKVNCKCTRTAPSAP